MYSVKISSKSNMMVQMHCKILKQQIDRTCLKMQLEDAIFVVLSLVLAYFRSRRMVHLKVKMDLPILTPLIFVAFEVLHFSVSC